MQVTINGKPQEVEDDLSVADLLAVRNLEPVRVAVEINEELVPRRRFAETPVRPGDRIEIVTLVGGG
ncbi:MAG: sulfur carrier protein ThiS [Planctomycetota bacterium]|nr:MAG: sulfur carrier protein ThiS [Planctomycetota bacterium]